MTPAIVQISDASARLLKELAEKTGLTTSVVLDKALDAYKRKVFLEQLNAAYAALRADPAAWADVEAERQSMAGSLMDGLDPDECWGEDGDLLPPRERPSNG
jgi:hypothetical protein